MKLLPVGQVSSWGPHQFPSSPLVQRFLPSQDGLPPEATKDLFGRLFLPLLSNRRNRSHLSISQPSFLKSQFGEKKIVSYRFKSQDISSQPKLLCRSSCTRTLFLWSRMVWVCCNKTKPFWRVYFKLIQDLIYNGKKKRGKKKDKQTSCQLDNQPLRFKSVLHEGKSKLAQTSQIYSYIIIL